MTPHDSNGDGDYDGNECVGDLSCHFIQNMKMTMMVWVVKKNCRRHNDLAIPVNDAAT